VGIIMVLGKLWKVLKGFCRKNLQKSTKIHKNLFFAAFLEFFGNGFFKPLSRGINKNITKNIIFYKKRHIYEMYI